MNTGSATVTIARPPQEVWAAIADVTRMGEWSPECVSCRWVGGATEPAVGASFEGDNVAKLAGRTIKKWTTTSEVTACVPGETFAFVAEGLTRWTYTFAPAESGTIVTETFEYEATGVNRLYNLIGRPRTMRTGMQRTLERVKTTLES